MLLSHDHSTIKNLDLDFKDWHCGLPYYGFWSIDIRSPEWVELIAHYQEILSDILLKDYLRKPHITIFTTGLFDDLTTIKPLVLQFRAQINALKLQPFKINFAEFASLTNCPILRLEERDTLTKIRRGLGKLITEDREGSYIPHITLGLYNQAIEYGTVLKLAKPLLHADLPPLSINNLQFCYYETHSIKGPIKTLANFQL